MEILNILLNYSSALSLIVSVVLVICTIVNIVLTKNQVKATYDSVRMSNMPILVPTLKKNHLSEVFNENGRRQLHFFLNVKNKSSNAALDVYCFGEIILEYNNKIKKIVADMDSEFVPIVAEKEEIEFSVTFETKAIHHLFADLSKCHIKNIERIKTDPTIKPYCGPKIKIIIVYRNCFEEYFSSELLICIHEVIPEKWIEKAKHTNASIIAGRIEPDKTNGIIKILPKETYTLLTMNPRMVATNYKKINKKEIIALLNKRKENLTREFIESCALINNSK